MGREGGTCQEEIDLFTSSWIGLRLGSRRRWTRRKKEGGGGGVKRRQRPEKWFDCIPGAKDKKIKINPSSKPLSFPEESNRILLVK